MALLFAAHGRLEILTCSRFAAKSPSQPGDDNVNTNKLWYSSLPCGPPVCVRSASSDGGDPLRPAPPRSRSPLSWWWRPASPGSAALAIAT